MEKQAIPLWMKMRLTARELEILEKIVGPMCSVNREIALELSPQISKRTVDEHRKKIMAKLGAKNIVHLCRMVLCYGRQDQDRVDGRDVESDHGMRDCLAGVQELLRDALSRLEAARTPLPQRTDKA
jgi:DNA-binding CsgD family transcriptional regulator